MSILKYIKPFDDEGNVTMWLDKLHRTASVLKMECLVDLFPLLLEGPAYAVYKHLSDERKVDAE